MIEYQAGTAPYSTGHVYQFDVPLADSTFHTVKHTASVPLLWEQLARIGKDEFLSMASTNSDYWYTIDGLIDGNPAVIVYSRK